MRIHLAHSSTRCFIDSVDVTKVPRFGEVIDFNGLYQVDQTVWHLGQDIAATLYVTTIATPETAACGWSTDLEAAKDGKTKLLTIEVDGKRHTTMGGWDGSWSGNCWVYRDRRVRVGTQPIAWREPPEALGA